METEDRIKIFAGSSGQDFAQGMCRYLGIRLGISDVRKFSDGNLFVRVGETVRSQNVYLVLPIALHPNDEFTELLFWMDAFKRASASSVTAILPYFGYAKGDKKDEPRVSIRARVCAESIELAGADRIVCFDLHSPQIQGFFKKPVDHIYALPIFAAYLRRQQFHDPVLVSPDLGFLKQTRKFADDLGWPLAVGEKVRRNHDEKAEVVEIMGDVSGRDCLIVDDFTISGGTLADLARGLKDRGARRIVAVLSHCLIRPEGIARLEASPIEQIITTNSVANPYSKCHPRFVTLSAAPLFAETVRRIHAQQSVSPMFDSPDDPVIQSCLDYSELC
ncbi:MAG: ribose-phosphate pyrophosphokinase [Spirochaetales bacterium]